MKTNSVSNPCSIPSGSDEPELVQFGPEVQGVLQPAGKPLGGMIMFLLLLGLGAVMCYAADLGIGDRSNDGLRRVFAIVPVIVGVVCLYASQSRTYLDLANRQAVRSRCNALREVSRKNQSFENFKHVVVRYCRDDGLNTLEVSLKPATGRDLWPLVDFYETKDGFPREAYVFAKWLEKMTGLPLETLDDLMKESA